MKIIYFCSVSTMTSSPAFINITFIRSNSKVFYIIKVSVHEEANTEPWKHWKFHVLLYLHIYFDCSITSNFPVRFYIQNSLYRWRYYCRDTMNDYFMFCFFISCLVSSGIALIIMRIIPFFFNLTIIVRRSSPNIKFHRTLQ